MAFGTRTIYPTGLNKVSDSKFQRINSEKGRGV